MRVLVVDDHGLTRKYLREILLEDCGIDEVEEAGDGEETLPLIAAESFDLVTFDIGMPHWDGLSVLAEIGPSRPGCVSLVLSRLSGQGCSERALRLGAATYLVKGCPRALIRRLVRAMRSARRRPCANRSRNA
jgi:DNA-binding NarL/FixJ family response regulator